MPAALASGVAGVVSSAGFSVGQTIHVEYLGYLEILALGSLTEMTLKNLENAGSTVYDENAAPGTAAPIGSRVVPGGIQGPAGLNAALGAGKNEFYLLRSTPVALPNSQDVSGVLPGATGFMRFNGPAKLVEIAADPIPLAQGGTNGTDAITARASLGLGTMAVQAANAVAISGGVVAGITDLTVLDGGTGASDAATARTNLGIAGMGTQAANAVAITGGTIVGITDLALVDGGTGASDAATARTNLGAATLGANVNITSLGGLTTALSVSQGGTGAITKALARASLDCAVLGANNDITSLTGLTTPLSKAQGGTGAAQLPAFRSTRNGATQSIPATSVITQVQFNFEFFDTNSNYDTGSYRFTPTISGYYQLSGTVRFTGLTALDAVSIYIYKNGSAIAHYHKHSTDIDDSIHVSVAVAANGSTDYFDCRVAQSNAAPQDITGLDSECWFEGSWVA
jgi:hypothetical protein